MKKSFRKAERVKKYAEFKKAFRFGKKLRAKDLTAYICPNNLKINRLGVQAPKRSFKLSSQRNRIRRLLREAYRTNKEKIKTGHDIILVAAVGIKGKGFKEIEEQFLGALSKGKLIR